MATTIEKKLREIDRLRKKHKIGVVNLALKDSASDVLTEDMADYVIQAIRTGAKLLKRMKTLPTT